MRNVFTYTIVLLKTLRTVSKPSEFRKGNAVYPDNTCNHICIAFIFQVNLKINRKFPGLT